MHILLKINFFIKYIILFILLSMYSAFAEEQTITFDDGSTYIGNIVNGKMDGKGLFKSVTTGLGRSLCK